MQKVKVFNDEFHRLSVQIDSEDDDLLTIGVTNPQDRINSDKDIGERGAPAVPTSPVSWLDENENLGRRSHYNYNFQPEPIEQVINDIENWLIDMTKT